MLFFSPKGKRFGDFDIIVKDNRVYCIFIETLTSKQLQLSGNCLGLASSSDGINWNYQGTVMKPTKTKWNSGSLWAMNIFQEKDQYFLAYSAVEKTTKDWHYAQQVGLAKSNNLIDWQDIQEEPIITNNHTDQYYYQKNFHKFCWRDPDIHKINNDYYCLLVAKDIAQYYETSACVALLKSKNLKDWQTLPPLFSPKKYWEIETPHLYKINDKWYLIYGTYVNDISMSYALSDSPLSEFQEPELNSLTPSHCYAGRIIKFQNEYYFYHWIRDKFQGKNKTYLAPPKILEVKNNRLFLKKYSKLKFKKSFVKESKANFSIKIRTKNQNYSRNISINKTKLGISIRDYNLENQINDLRTIPLKLDKMNLEVMIEGKFIEIYLNGYFIHSAILEECFELSFV